jgi:hypothetical protein
MFDPSFRSSANTYHKCILRPREPVKFLVVFEGCSGRAPHCADADTAKIRSLQADILQTYSLWVFWWGASEH